MVLSSPGDSQHSEGVGPLHHVEPIHLMELTRPYDGCALVYRTTAGMPLSMPFEAPNTPENPPLSLMGAAGPASVGGWLQLRGVRPPSFYN